ncbi:ABC transporter ATP-binding protein [uncultured Paludibaculum sp.]|uniref:ABC transporter ATP-binding protein n=1 Tax=uncultured Paludibaculum sp. TaxID=1765020 RepID=UPI002AAC3CF2|nr:ABC transporter ATP-binding protein [uncultured Paludibaculum sp.]
MSVSYALDGVGMSYGEADVLSDVTLRFDQPGMVALTGPNGAGKSTLLNIMSGLRGGFRGSCKLNGKDIAAWPRRDFARQVALVPQSLKIDFPFTAEQVVLMGRTPYAGGLFENPEDWAAVAKAMELTDIAQFRHRDFRALSGGERQRVVLASALAQEPRALLLDEPTTFLDLQHQLSIYSLLRNLSREGLLVIAVTHDLNLAAAYSDRVVALKNGRVAADADPCQALAADKIREVFGVEAEWLQRPGGKPWIAYGD